MPGIVLEASGHVNHFKEPLVGCKKCKRKFRADHLLQEFAGMSDTETEKLNLKELMKQIKERSFSCPECDGELVDPRQFLTMFATTIGPYSESVGYGRPEAAQGIFVEFKRLYEFARGKLPFAVAQLGHALRNEISPRQGPVRLREFTIMDLEFFFDPEEPSCPLIKDVGKEVLRILLAETKLKGGDEPVEVSLEVALKKGYIKSEWQAFFMVLAKRFLVKLGIPEDKQRFIEKLDWERAHYSLQGFDQEVYLDRWGWTEISGHNYRSSYDLKRHMKFSGVDMQVYKELEKPQTIEKLTVKPLMSKMGPAFKGDAQKVAKLISTAAPKKVEAFLKKEGFYIVDSFKVLPEHIEIVHEEVEQKGRRFIPHVVEPSFGLDRLVYAVLEYAHRTKEDRTLLRLPLEVVPIQVGVFPLVSKDGLPEKAEEVYRRLINEGFRVEYDESGSIGRRYARADEVGTPIGVTVDYQTLKDRTVTLRDRDTWKQVRTKIEDLPPLLRAYFSYMLDFKKLGKATESS
jgi:glycyl-tRNA synthetase